MYYIWWKIVFQQVRVDLHLFSTFLNVLILIHVHICMAYIGVRDLNTTKYNAQPNVICLQYLILCALHEPNCWAEDQNLSNLEPITY